MLGFVAKLMLTLSALAPVAFVYSYVSWMQNQPDEGFWALIAGIVAVVSCMIVLQFAHRFVSKSKFSIKEVEAADSENISFMLLYLLPLFTDKIETLNWYVWAPTLMLLALLVGNGYAHHFNPLLGLARWHFYKVGTAEGVTFILISRRRLAEVLGTPLVVGELTDSILFDLGDKHDHDASRVLQA